MKISYNWLKSYLPEIPDINKLTEVLTYHLFEVEELEKKDNGDFVFEIKILPNRAHDLLSHQGLAREISSLLNIEFKDPISSYKIPKSIQTDLKIKIETSKCRRYMGRIVRNIKIGPSPRWVVEYLKSIGQRSINNVVDATNLVMYDLGQPTHVFDLEKIKNEIIIRQANLGEKLTILSDTEVEFTEKDMVISDQEMSLAIAGIKGGKKAEVDEKTQNILLEVANFDPVSVRKTGQFLNIFTDSRKRFENNLSPSLSPYAMQELSALIMEMCPEAIFEDIIDVYPEVEKERNVSFKVGNLSKILGISLSVAEVKNILDRYKMSYSEKDGDVDLNVPKLRLDLETEEDIAEEVGRVLGYQVFKPLIPKIKFLPQKNNFYEKISKIRNNFLSFGYSEVITYAFRDSGEVQVMQSASDKNFLRTNLSSGLKESLRLNKINAPLLGLKEVKIFEIGSVFLKDREEIRVAFNIKDEIFEMTLEEFNVEEVFTERDLSSIASSNKKNTQFKMWSLFPFISRDLALWVPENTSAEEIMKIIKSNCPDLLVRGPELFDEFKKDGRISYAFRLVFQSFEKTLTDVEVNEIMENIFKELKKNSDWELR